MMNELIEGAHFSARAAEEQRLRERRRADVVHLPEGVTDVQRVETFWDRAADAFREHDPDGRILAELIAETRR